MNDFTAFISNVGFPIAMCMILIYFFNIQFVKTIEGLENVVSQLKDVVNQNTNIITKLCEQMEDNK